jgi:hypothetical protein
MTAFNVRGRTAQTANPRAAQKFVPLSRPLPRHYRAGEFASEEVKKYEYRRDHEARIQHAKRCIDGEQFRDNAHHRRTIW